MPHLKSRIRCLLLHLIILCDIPTYTFGRTPHDEWSARRRDPYLHNTLKTETSMTPAGFEPAIPAVERPQAHNLDRAATRNGRKLFTTYISLEPRDFIWFNKLYFITAEFQHIHKKTSIGYTGYQLIAMRACTHLIKNTATLTVCTNVVRYISIHVLSHTSQ